MTRLKRISVGLFSLLLITFLNGCKPQKTLKDYAIADTSDSLMMSAKSIFRALPPQADNPDNPLNPEKVSLGQRLYFDTRLSAKGKNSCNSCHDLSRYGVDNEATSTGDDGHKGDRNSPTVLNAALNGSQFWDGRAKDVEEQAGMPIMNPVEMHMPSQAFLEERLQKDDEYPKLFAAAFPKDKHPLSYHNLQLAIGAFERTLLTPGRFDDYLNGRADALSADEKEGLSLFLKTGCNACHAGVNLGGQQFQKFGIFGNYRDLTKSIRSDSGRITLTHNPADLFVFRVPSLRNVEKTWPYFHDGSVSDLGDAVKIMAKLQLNKTLKDEEVKSLVAFLKTLTGKVPEVASKDPFRK